MQIAGIELANIGEPLPVANRQFAVAEFHGAGSAQRLQRAIDGHQRHSLGVAKLSLMKRQWHRSRSAKARTARAVIQFAEWMRHPCAGRPAAVVGDRLPEKWRHR